MSYLGTSLGMRPDRVRYAYAVSEQGVLNVIDWNDVASPQVLSNLAFDFNGAKLTDVEICSSNGVMFIGAGAADTVSNGKVHVLSTVQRASPSKPVSYGVLTTGPLPDMILPNSDCTKLAVANEGEGEYDSELVDPHGSVMIIEASDWTNPNTAVTKSVALSGYTDSQLMDMGVCLGREGRQMSGRGTCRCPSMPWCPSAAAVQSIQCFLQPAVTVV